MIDLRPDFLDTLKRLLAEIVPDCEVRIFGSRYQWTTTDASDLDLALVGPGKLHWKTLTRLKAALEESSLPYRVDVLDWRAISPEFQKVIEQGYEVIQKPELVRSSKEWGKYRLQNLCSYITDGKHGDCRNQDNSGFYFLSAKDVSEGRLFYEKARQITKEDFEDTHKRTRLEAFDILLTNSGTIGRMAVAEDHELTSRTTFQKSVAILKPIKQKVFPRFLYYCLVSRKSDIVNTASGTTQQNLLLGDLRSFEVEIPEDIETQRRIADILSVLDEKIELNRQTNATLEAIAQAIFKEWFVEFNFPRATGEMQDSEIGPIPRGWRVGTLGDVCSVTMGQSPPGESYNETGDGIPFYQGRTDFGFRFPTKRVFTTDPKRFAKQFDTLVSVRAPVGDMNIAAENCCIGRGLASVIEKNGNYSFTYYFLRELTEKFKSFEDNGTVFGSINKTDFENMPCIVPNDGAIIAFENKCRSIDESIFNNEQESSTLAALRDALLPKLMRGEIEA
ncbi:MAG: restriction endonuclease subunit S [Deltaproteobacteria bacterium]|nr:restriction endonuclease subunit S [Deltaproteobacteria bacterium]